LWAYPVVAFVAGWIAERGQFGFVRDVIAGATAEAVLFAGGLSWLAAMTHSWQRAAFFGLYPFLVAELLKVTVAAAAALRLRRSL
jgi:biotin transporter BioY